MKPFRSKLRLLREIIMEPNHTLAKSVPTSAEQEFLEDRLYEFNTAQVGQDDGQLFGFLIRDEEGEILAGLSGWTWAQACEIRTLWVHPDWRGKGCGQRLLEAAEQEARSRGCRVILLSSYSFQAPAYYQKQGYTLAWRLEDFPPGHSQCYLVKRLAGPEK